MCGISAIFGEEKDKEAKLKLSLSKIAHRGDPDINLNIKFLTMAHWE